MGSGDGHDGESTRESRRREHRKSSLSFFSCSRTLYRFYDRMSNANSSFPLLLVLLFLPNQNLLPSFQPKPSSPSPPRRPPPRILHLFQLLSFFLPRQRPTYSLLTAQTKTPRRQRVLKVLSRRGQIPDGRRWRTRREVDVSIRRRRRREEGALRTRSSGRRGRR